MKYKTSKLTKSTFSLLLLLTLVSTTLYIANFAVNKYQNYVSEASTGNSYYVSTTGSDTAAGTLEAPLRTLDVAWRRLVPGDTLYIMGGTYAQTLKPNTNGTATLPITISAYGNERVIIDGRNTVDRPVELIGSYTVLKNIEVMNSSWACVVAGGHNNTVSGLTVHECQSHGIYTEVSNTVIENNTVYRTNLENSARTWSSGWGSAIKLKMGANNVMVRNNRVFNNYGEGVAATRATNSIIQNNFFYDNYKVNIYVDNSKFIQVLDNLSTCTSNTTYTRNDKRPSAIALAEEYYSGWGNQLTDITVKNNVSAYCSHGFVYWGADSGGGGGMKNVNVMNNLFYAGTHSVLSIATAPVSTNNNISNNIFNGGTPWIEDATGISLHDNFWIGSLPSLSTLARGVNDIAGTVTFATMPPVYDNRASFNIVSSSPTFPAGFYGPTMTTTPPTATPAPTPTSSTAPTPTPTTTPTPSPSPLRSPSPSPLQSPSPTPTAPSSPTPTPTPVTYNTSPSIATSSLPSGTYFSYYTTPLRGTDPDAADTLSMRSTGLPKGLSIGGCSQSIVSGRKQLDCKISGRPRARGTFNVVITISDNVGNSSQRSYTLIVN